MRDSTQSVFESRGAVWTGRIIAGAVVLFLVMDAAMKVVKTDAAVEGSAELGYPESTLVGIGLALLVCTAIYAVPRTAFLGAILLSGYLGGATATQVRLEDPWFLFPIALGVLVWVSLYLRDSRIRALIALSGPQDAGNASILSGERRSPEG